MNKTELRNAIDNCDLELRALMDSVKDTSKEVNLDEVRAKKAELEEKRAKLVKDLAQAEAPADKPESRNALFDAAEWRKLATGEVRSLTIGSTGAINQIKELFHQVADNDEILSKASFYYGPNAATNIPVLAPLADPDGYAEGTTNVSVDTDANLGVTSITPKAHVSILPITAEALNMGTIDLEKELPAIFEKAFTKSMHKEMIIGSGANTMEGLFTTGATTSATVTTIKSNATAVKVSDLAALALICAAKDEEYEIVMNPAVYAGVVADSTSGEDVKIYKEGLIRDKMIEGVKVRLDGKAPTTFGTGKTVVVAAPLSRYAIGVAGQINIDPIKVKGDTNTYFQATMFFNGKQISAKDLVTIACA